MIFSRTNPPPGYYHYLYLREDGTPYYSGKGKEKRAWAKDHTIKPPTDPERIIITHWGLTELWAFAMERWHIRWYGRKDNGTGILRNKTDGGDGASGLIRTESQKRAMSIALKGKKKNPLTAEHKKKISEFFTGRSNAGASRPGELNTFYGKKHTAETLAQQSEVKQGEKNPMFGRVQLRACCLVCKKEGPVNTLALHHKH